MIKVMIADDHTIVRDGLKQILAEEEGIQVIGEADNGHDILRMALSQEVDVVVLDISMPGKDGLRVLKELQEEKPSLPVLILTMHSEDQYAIRVMRAGAAGYLTKKSAAGELTAAIRKVANGQKYMTPSLASKLVSTMEKSPDDAPHEDLSDREYQVLCLIAVGKKLKDIGEELCLSPKTVSTYQARIIEKLNVDSTADLIRYAMEKGLVN
ncbi:MAG: response regulator transcription factor [Proteobacteria bacterium]|nr:response regulator transcription factor [Pseudomonadota bacterium]MBU1687482.1 response regulator transcription factor [Pseudomonadota bacterium]